MKTQFERIAKSNYMKRKNALEKEFSNKTLTTQKQCSLENQIRELQMKLDNIEKEKALRKLRKIKEIHIDIKEGVSKEMKRILKEKQINSRITKIQNQKGEVFTENESIQNEFFSFYQNLYDDKTADENEKVEILEFFAKHRKISEKLNNNLSKPFTLLEVESAILKLNKDSAPGPDGLTSAFYQMFARLWAPILQKLFNDAEAKGVLPDSFKLAIIEVLPKVENASLVKDYRPISLINTDQKIFSHVLASRIKKLTNEIISHDQIAYIQGRQIHQAINLTRLASQNMDRKSCIVALDFSKAFDCVDRNYLFRLLEAIEFPPGLMRCIKAIYNETQSVVEINYMYTGKIRIKRGVRQGCPLSALLFIIAIEPLLLKIKTDQYIETNFVTKISAYADDITCFVKGSSLEALFDTVDIFGEATQLKINVGKTEILCPKKLGHYKVQKEIKILGITHQSNGEVLNTQQKFTEVQKAISTISKRVISNRAKAINFDIFIFSKLIYILRHSKLVNAQLEHFQRNITKAIWGNKRAAVSSSILCLPSRVGGIGLPNIKLNTLAAKLIDLKNIYYQDCAQKPMLVKQLNTKKKSYFRDLKIFLQRNQKVKLELDASSECLTLTREGSQMDLNKETSMKRVYYFLLETDELILKMKNRPASSCNVFKVTLDQLLQFNNILWESQTLYPHEKNLMYRIMYLACSDKSKMKALGQIQDDLCIFCKKFSETIEHLLFDCLSLEKTRKSYGIQRWKDIFIKKSHKAIHFSTNVLIGAWKKDKKNTIKYLETYLSRWSQADIKIGRKQTENNDGVFPCVFLVFCF